MRHPPFALNAEKILATTEALGRRIDARFPNAGLGKVCRQLFEVGARARQRADWIARPLIVLRLATALVVGALFSFIGLTFLMVGPQAEGVDLVEFIQVLESATNEVILAGAALFFLVTIETRIKRRRAMAALHELRSIAHLIDMHQLTKDPERVLSRAVITDVSPKIAMSRAELGRYLDYCSEMLSLVGKLGVLYVQKFDDAVVLSAVNELEALTTGLSRKIWQKLMILHFSPPDEPARAA